MTRSEPPSILEADADGHRHWNFEVHQCDHLLAYMQLQGGEKGVYHEGYNFICRMCGQRWQRLNLVFATATEPFKMRVKPYQPGIQMPPPPGDPFGKEAVEARL